MSMRKFAEFVMNPHNTSPEAVEVMRELQIVMNNALQSMPKVNGYGINDIKFDFISEQKGQQGIQLNLEAKGSATAKNTEHVSGMLQKLVDITRNPLGSKNMFFEIMYHRLHTSENMYEDASGNLYFNVISAVLLLHNNI